MITFVNSDIYVRKYVKQDGSSPTYLQVNIGYKIKNYPLHVNVKLQDWNEKTKSIKHNVPNALELNHFLHTEKERAKRVFIDLKLQQKEISFKNFEELYLGKVDAINDFYEFASKELERKKVNLAAGTYKSQFSELTKLRRFAPVLKIQDIDLDFIKRYEYYMRNELKNKVNTVSKTMKRLKTFLNLALENNLIAKSPFSGIKLKHERVHRNYLNESELKLVENLLVENGINEKIIRITELFLFSCYTGLRYTDVIELKKDNIKEGKYIELIQHKTNDKVLVPLTDKSKAIVAKRMERADSNLFDKISNQKLNDYLKVMALQINLDKNLTFHCARHTFATISLNLGIPIEVVSKLLGHNELRTTQIYAKVVDKTKFEQMEKWNVRPA